tara:strand:+ start:4318 stop:4740 length:423 start_codon:yes stop_codon:yes gene_type:complete
MKKKHIAFLLTKQIGAMVEIDKLDNILNENLLEDIKDHIDFTDYIMDEIGLPDEGEVCIATEDFDHLKNGDKTFKYCRDWVFDTVYDIAHSTIDDKSFKIIDLINEMEEHSTNIIMLKDKELLMEAGNKAIKKINKNLKN